jgi:hypothetical protein
MATVTVIKGLSGSGKTEYLNQMVDVIPFNEGVRPDKPENMDKFLDALGTGKDCAIVEIAYLTEYGRNELVRLVRERFPDTVFKWVYFKRSSPSRVGKFRMILDRLKHAGENLQSQVFFIA